ncbi:MAG: hypothetical protein CSA68_06640 [Rhodobacterales bacterium]|nr:MAG: hypothetical protein CSA68_06640 [Rhodobacterales bacterium]
MARTSIASETAITAAQNDRFRYALIEDTARPDGLEGKVFVPPGVMANGDDFVRMALPLTAKYSTFQQESDPYGLHEMGVITVFGIRVWWRIDLYDTDYRYGSDAPADPEQTRRVLTVLLPSEY